jgi:hypothetical protein
MAALDPLIRRYLDMAWPILPLQWNPFKRNFKQPLVEHGLLEASCEARVVEAWLKRWPMMIIGIRTGEAPLGAGIVVLDVDTKPGKTGHLTMRALGFADPPRTPMVITGSGGRHLDFLCPAGGFSNTQGNKGRGIGKDVDWRGNNGYVGAPGGLSVYYRWHNKCNLDTCPILPVPPELMPREPVPEPELGDDRGAVRRVVQHADAYVEVMLDRACKEILGAGDGEQNLVLNGTSYNVGRTAARRNLAHDPLIAALIDAGLGMQNYRPSEPWTRAIVERRVRDGFAAGQRKEGK